MNRDVYYNYIEERIVLLSHRVEKRGKLNILNFHTHTENFYRDFFNQLYSRNLINFNEVLQNVEAIDLVCDVSKTVIQVSATCTKEKIESALSKDICARYKDYNFEFISIAKDAESLRGKTYLNPHGIKFDPVKDIHDVLSVLKKVLSLDIASQEGIYLFIKAELGNITDPVKFDTNLAVIVNILSKINLDQDLEVQTLDPFEIERKISYNSLDKAKFIIEDCSTHHNRLDKIYSEFDMLGVNKSKSVLTTIRGEYVENISKLSGDDLFFAIIKKVQEKIKNSSNFEMIPTDELELCVNVIVVDAFIRCKIFKNPNNYVVA